MEEKKFCDYEGKCMKVCDCDKCHLNYRREKFLITVLVILVGVLFAGGIVISALGLV